MEFVEISKTLGFANFSTKNFFRRAGSDFQTNNDTADTKRI